MGRCTQYIGLNRYGDELVKGLKTPAVRREWVNGYLSAYDEHDGFWLRRWDIPAGHELNKWDEGNYLREVVQEAPCSGGPMYFTCLELVYPGKTYNPENGDPTDAVVHVCEWVHDPSLKENHVEYDYDSGRLWV